MKDRDPAMFNGVAARIDMRGRVDSDSKRRSQ